MNAGDLRHDSFKFKFELRQVCAILLFCAAMLAGCSNSAPPASKYPTYKMRGTVAAVHANDKSASIDSEAITGFMDAMTMEYTIRDSAALSRLKPKDKITAELIADPNGAYIGNVKIEPAK